MRTPQLVYRVLVLAAISVITQLGQLRAAVTPAGDISAGTFGTNTGGGNYGLGTIGGPLAGLFHVANGGVFYETNLTGPSVWGFNYYKSRGTSGAKAIVVNGDSTGFFTFYGYDGASFIPSSAVRGEVDGSPAANAMPGRIVFSTTALGGANVNERMRITAAGFVGIGTPTPVALLDVAGNVNVSGNIAAKYQDVAEWVPATKRLEPGTVVVLNRDKANEVIASEHAYDTAVAGVVSRTPGVILGEASPNKEKIATAGRVRVHVDATTAAIRVGDLLVTSDKPGVAMRSLPVDIAGVKMHRPGTIIGKALEPLPSGEGDILVLLSLQ